MNNVLLLILLPWLSFSFCTNAATTDVKAELERVVISYEKLRRNLKLVQIQGIETPIHVKVSLK